MDSWSVKKKSVSNLINSLKYWVAFWKKNYAKVPVTVSDLWSFSVCQLSIKDSKTLSHQLVFYAALKQHAVK